MEKLNELEKALLAGREQMDYYLEIEPTMQIIADIQEIKKKAALSTPAGELADKIQSVLNEFKSLKST